VRDIKRGVGNRLVAGEALHVLCIPERERPQQQSLG
jgi:hypothetical protein